MQTFEKKAGFLHEIWKFELDLIGFRENGVFNIEAVPVGGLTFNNKHIFIKCKKHDVL